MLERLEQYWIALQVLRAEALTEGSRRAIEQVMDAFADDLNEVIQGRKEWEDSRVERAHAKQWH